MLGRWERERTNVQQLDENIGVAFDPGGGCPRNLLERTVAEHADLTLTQSAHVCLDGH